jgi:hypothetical protein
MAGRLNCCGRVSAFFSESRADKQTSFCFVAARRYIRWPFSPSTGHRFREHNRPFWPHPLFAYLWLTTRVRCYRRGAAGESTGVPRFSCCHLLPLSANCPVKIHCVTRPPVRLALRRLALNIIRPQLFLNRGWYFIIGRLHVLS